MKLRSHLAFWFSLAVIYALAVLPGLGSIHIPLPKFPRPGKHATWSAWQAPNPNTIPAGPTGDSIRYGIQLFNSTPVYAPQYTGNKLACSDCHIEGGIVPHASPMVGLPTLFPMYSKRAGHVVSIEERIQECFTRSENGTPPPEKGGEMNALVAYIQWLSQPEPARQPFTGRGLIDLPALQPNPKHGARVYAEQCANCHGKEGSGHPPLIPPLWGPDSFNDGAGINDISKMARFVQHTMPQTCPGILSPQAAYDVSAYIHTKPRPKFNPAYKKY